MPRTKQIHPRNLRDKIEEAQKELNGAEVSKTEILEAGVKGASESLKGVKRKKIVAENHLKKIPKSPLRNPLQTKHKQNTEASSFPALQSTSEAHKKHSYSPVKNGKQFTKQNGETPGLIAETTKSEGSVSLKRPSFLSHPAELRRWRSEGSEPIQLGVLEEKQPWGSSPSPSRSDHSESVPHPLPRCSTSSPSYTSTAFDVLLKAMEPELSTLSQKGSTCAIRTEKLRPNKTVRSPSTVKNSSGDASGHTTQEIAAESQSSPGTYCPVPVAATQKDEPTAAQPVSQPHHPQEHFASTPNQHDQQPPGHPAFTGLLTNLQTPENANLEQIYNTAMASTIGLTSPSCRTQVVPAPTQQVEPASPASTSPAHPTPSPPRPPHSSAPVVSVVGQSGEQVCSLLLREQKPKKPGKYVCEYCSRACAKPSVLLKHIRSHTGERPYPCVTCGFSFKTKSNLYKHKKSHAHTLKLGLVLQPDAGALFLAQESPRALSVHSDVEDSGESEEEGSADGRQNDSGAMELRPMQILKKLPNLEALPQSGSLRSNPDHVAIGFSPQNRPSESEAVTELPKVVIQSVSMSPFKTDSSKPEPASMQGQKDLQLANTLSETEEKSLQKGDLGQPGGGQEPRGGPAHAQLQRQQATDDSQEQQGKLLSPRSLGSTDSGYFSRSESADQAVSPPTPFARNFPTMDLDSVKNSAPPAPRVSTPAPTPLCVAEKPSVSPGQMRPPLATKTLEERISKLISDNEALVDDKQLDSVKPRRTSLSRRGSIDSPKSYIFKDSFQFDLKPMGRRTSSSSDIPKSPFTPTEKSKQVFLLSVPSLDCLPITRSNSMPTTGCSAVPPSVIPPTHPLRGSQSFDDKIGTFYDDVFVSGPNPSVPHSGHPRPLVRQAAVEDPSASEHHVGVGPSLDEGCQGCPGGGELGPGRSKPATQPSHLEKKKSHQGRGTMFECETCRNRYRKLENFENHKKFYCSELHGPKTKVAVREPEPSPVPSGTQPQVLHYRVAAPPGVWEQTPQIRKRRKMKSVGDDEDPQPRESRALKSAHAPQLQPAPGSAPSPSTPSATLTSEQPPGGLQVRSSPAQARLVARGSEQVQQQLSRAAQDQLEGKRQGTGISVIQHTNSLSRPSSLDKSEPCEGGSVASFQELRRAGKPEALKVIGVAPEEGHPLRDVLQPRQSTLSDALKGELQESSRTSPGDRHGSGLPSRLVRQHHIQVPEILVTEEPDGGQEAQGPEEEKAETFSWPQRSETLSKLPTEKLPPKKKRLRLAEMEHSSTESSFDSTLSRSPSRESSLSHTSSFSASLDIEDISKTEASPKIDFPPRAEFLLIPPGSNTLSIPGSHREMRRAASEQITCVPTLMEVSEFRSKSFDCGSMTPPRAAALPESQPFTAPSAVGLTGHVPLLERRRGPLIRQISLNIAPDSHLPPLHASPFQSITLPSVKTGPQGLQPPNTPPAGFPAHTLQSWTRTTDLPMERSSTGSADSFPPQQSFGTSLLNQTHVPLSHQSLQPPLVASALGVRADARSAVCVSSTGAVEDCFPPKYQLHCQLPPSSQACSANPLRPLPNQVLADPAAADHSPASVVLPAEAGEPVASSSTVAALQPGLPGNQVRKEPVSFLLPIHLQTKSATYCFATSLPQILVTQDLSNMPVCQTNQSPVPISEEQTPITALPKDPPNALPTPENDLPCKNILSDMGKNSPVSESLPGIQKTSVGRLSPQQESSASSKRMLSPANSLDIAMEKHQKRAKDEHGAVCAPNMRPSEPPTSRASDGQKQKKPVLVRQLCTTEPLEGGNSEQEDFSQPETSNKTVKLTDVLPADTLSSGPSRFVVTEPISELQEFENSPPKSLTVTVGNPHVPLENAHVSPVKSVGSTQERKSPGIKNQGDKTNVKGQSPPPPSGLSLSSTSDPQQLSFPSLKTATSFTWCYLLRQKSLPLPQNDQKTSAYTEWTVSPTNPNPLDLPTKVALSLLNSKQKTGKSLYCEAVTTHSKSDLLVYSSKWKNTLSKRALGNQKSTVVEFSNKDASEINSEQDKENSLIKSEPRRIKIFDGGYKSNEEYVYVRGRGRGKYICEECGIRCKKPSMLKKHIRTHTDVRPYHCTYCNFSFKTKGNLTKHMKSKAHSKKCVDLGVSVGLIDEQDTEESDEKQRFGIERSGYDLEESDGPDEDDNDNEDDDEDSQADSGLSAAPSVTASPQHLPSSSGLEDLGCTEEDLKIPEYFSGAHTDPMDILPRALLTKMTVLSTVQSDPHKRTNPPSKARQHAAQGEDETVPSVDASRPLETAPRSPCRQMSVDHPESEVLGSSVTGQAVALTQDTSCVRLPSVGAQHSPQPAPGIQSATSPHLDSQERKPQTPSHPPPGLPSSQTHLFSHLPLHSQQQSRTPYNMVPVGGIHVVPAGLTYSTFVPIQAGPVQLTIPAVSVFHRTMGTPGDTITDVSGTANPAGVAELSSVVPCIPIGQIRVPGLPNLSPPGLQSLTSLGMETVNIVGLASANLGPQVHPPGLALNAVGLQVLTGPPAQSSPGLQILNIALPTLIPSVSQVRVGTPGVPETAAARGKVEIQPQPQQSQAGNPESPHCTPDGQQENATGSAGERPRLEGPSTVDATQAACIGQGMSAPEGTTTTVQAQAQPTHSPEAPWKATPCGPQTVPADRPPRGPLRQPTAHFSDVSSDDDEDRLVIAT